MKNVVSLAAMLGLILSSSAVFAIDSCIKCHKSIDKIAENIKKSGAKSADELVDFLKNKSPKKALHKNVKDEDIKQAFAAAVASGEKKDAKKDNATANATKEEKPRKKKVEGC